LVGPFGDEVDVYKVEWDSSPLLDTQGNKPESFSIERGSSPETPNTYFDITGITAHNSLGYGESAPVAAGKPMQQSTEPSTVDLTISNSDDPEKVASTLEVSFTAPADDGGDTVTKYMVEWSLDGLHTRTNEVQVISVHTSAVEQLRLTMDTTNCTHCRTKEVAASAFIFSNSTAAQLELEIENIHNVGVVSVKREMIENDVVSFVVEFVEDMGDIPTFSAEGANVTTSVQGTLPIGYQSDVVSDLGSGPFTYTMQHLTAGQQYCVRASPYNQMGYCDSLVSTPACAIPPFQEPYPPTNFYHETGSPTLYVSSDSSLDVYWGAPTFEGGSPVSKYWLQWDTVDTFDSQSGVPFSVILPVSQDDTMISYRIEHLDLGSTYFVRVAAYNAERGYGDWAYTRPSWAVPHTYPSVVGSVDVKVNSRTSLDVQWTDAVNNGSPIDTYKIEWFLRRSEFPYWGRIEKQIVSLASSDYDEIGWFTLGWVHILLLSAT
jgi:hypothetical protein